VRREPRAAESERPHEDSRDARHQRLAAALREAAARAAADAGGGLALVFASEADEADSEAAARLRAAAGFATPEAARAAASQLLPSVREVLRSGSAAQLPADAALGPRAAGGLAIHPLGVDGHRLGALAVAYPAPLSAAAGAALRERVELLALRLDHARLAGHGDGEGAGGERGDEILKLSEALFAQDIELLRSQEKLGKIEKLKNDFIERMSRELRTPLNGIIEAIILVLTGENEALSEEAKQTLRCALDDGTAFLRTLQNILDLWRIKQGELPVEIQDVNFREIVDEAIFSVQDSLADKPLVIETRLADPFPKVRTDLAKLNQILFLLLDNAVKFTRRGTVTISARVESGRLSCEVRDTGIGICADDQAQVFDEFFQVDEPASRRYAGAGLGLTLVRDLLILLDGDIAVKSDVGIGSSFTFAIPVQVVG
jgi:signal transduction histidine kinase